MTKKEIDNKMLKFKTLPDFFEALTPEQVGSITFGWLNYRVGFTIDPKYYTGDNDMFSCEDGLYYFTRNGLKIAPEECSVFASNVECRINGKLQNNYHSLREFFPEERKQLNLNEVISYVDDYMGIKKDFSFKLRDKCSDNLL